MLTCEQLAELVTDYIECWLPMRQRLRFRLHIILCSACRRYLNQMRLTIRTLKSLPRRAPRPAMEQELLRRFRSCQQA
jgi:hypothetical protein